MIIFGRVALMALLAAVPTKRSSESEPPRAETYFHYLAGSLASLERDSRRALEHFRFASHLDPQSTSLMLRQAQELAEIGDNDSAKEILPRVSQEQEDNSEYQLLVSRLASQELDVDASVKALDRAIEIFKKEDNQHKLRETILTKVALLADFKKYPECVETLTSYLKREPDDEIAYYFLGKIHSVFQNREAAKRAYRKAIDLRPNFSAAARSLGMQLELEGKLQDAFKVYEQSAEVGGADDETYQKLINLSLILENYEGALRYLKQYLTIQPDDAQAMLRAGLIHFKLREFAEAKEIFENLLKKPDVAEDRVHFYLASVLEELGNLQDSVDHYLKVSEASDYFVESRLQASYLLSEKIKNDELSLSTLEQAVRTKGDDADLIVALANQYEKKSQVAKGLDLLVKSNERFKDNEKLLFLLGVFQEKSGALDHSIATMKKVLVLNPNNPHALNHIGYSYTERNTNLSEAEQLLIKAIQLAPDNGFILDSLGFLYYKMGKYKRASEFLEKANRLAPGQVVILEHLADTYKKLGREKDALAVYRQIMGWSAKSAPIQTSSISLDTHKESETRAVQDRVRTKIAAITSEDPN